MDSWLLNTEYPKTLIDMEDSKFKFLDTSGYRKNKTK